MKKTLAAVLALTVMLLASACSATKPTEATAPETEQVTEAATEAATEATTEATTEPETEPETEPTTEPLPDPPVITKNPTDEYHNEGENAIFIANAENYNYVYWTVYDPAHDVSYDARDVAWHFDGLSVEGDNSNELILYNLPMGIDGWCVEATFVGDAGSVSTDHAYVYVAEVPEREQLWANPSGGTFYSQDGYVTLTSNPGDVIHYTVFSNQGGGFAVIEDDEINSGDTIYIEAAVGCNYTVKISAYVVGDESNNIHCVYEVDYPVGPVLPPEHDDNNGGHGGFVGPVLPPRYK